MEQATAMRRMGIDEEEPARRPRLVADLNRDLAGLLDLAAGYKQAHWNVIGPSFAALHALFDSLAAETAHHADLVADRALALGGMAEGTLQLATERSVLPLFPAHARGERIVLEALEGRAARMADELRAAAAGSADDLATQDVHLEILRAIEMQRWMLRAHLLEQENGLNAA
ncbi:MAG: DNA starvation/stationary phase protection protein Dps [Candidatus Limnocylindria bacterium]